MTITMLPEVQKYWITISIGIYSLANNSIINLKYENKAEFLLEMWQKPKNKTKQKQIPE